MVAPKNPFPAWFSGEAAAPTLHNAVAQRVGDFKEIISVVAEPLSKKGENYSSILLNIEVAVAMNDDSTKKLLFLLKTQHCDEVMANILNMLQLFPKEEDIYFRILPKFEKLYRDAGKSVTFGPRAFKFDQIVSGVEYILLENLHQTNYRNVNRTNGFDMDHMKQILIKLAEFHAASASYVEHFGMYGEEFTKGVFKEVNRQLLKEFNVSGAFLTQLKNWKDAQKYYEKLADSDNYLVDRLLQDQQVDPREFNVLNHGDCWANNIMFQYDAFGKIKNTLFVDFQVGKYGTPANDLYYLILSSASMDIKLTQFDYFIRFYYDHLIENLKLLQYQRPLPKLRNLHATLLKNGLAAYMVVSKVLPVVILEKTDDANLESYMQDESKMKTAMFTNHKYVKAMSEIMPWMDNRGLLDWK